MLRKFLIIETFFNEEKQNFYYLKLPEVREDGFYRQTMSFNAFFSSIRNPHANVTEIRQFTSHYNDEIKFKKDFFKNVNWNNLKTFDTIWDFYEFIGYDRKKRKYKSGEVLKHWGDNGFFIPKKGKNAKVQS